MQLTKFSDYALRVLIFLARHPAKHTTIQDVADAHDISKNHLMKVVHQLATRGYLHTLRGKGGGISLARPASEISIGAIVRETEPLAPAECFVPGYDRSCALYPACALRGALRAARDAFLTTLDGYRLSDVAGSRRHPLQALQRMASGTGASR